MCNVQYERNIYLYIYAYIRMTGKSNQTVDLQCEGKSNARDQREPIYECCH